jgi:hypothetical protein
VEQVDLKGSGEIGGQPGEQQIKGVVVGGEAQCQSDDFFLPQQIAEGCTPGGAGTVLGLGPAETDEIPLRSRKPAVFTRVPVEPAEQRKVNETDEAGGSETPPPAEVQQQDSDQRNADGR